MTYGRTTNILCMLASLDLCACTRPLSVLCWLAIAVLIPALANVNLASGLFMDSAWVICMPAYRRSAGVLDRCILDIALCYRLRAISIMNFCFSGRIHSDRVKGSSRDRGSVSRGTDPEVKFKTFFSNIESLSGEVPSNSPRRSRG